jgi:hypothetical protein
MITNVFAKKFKGQDFSIDIGEKNFFSGVNGSGKSSVWQAMAICRNGFLPGTKGKRPGDVAGSFSSGLTMVTGFVSDGFKYERRFITSSDGSVKQAIKVNDRKVSKAEFDAAMFAMPNIMDIGSFMELSDQKKIDLVCDLFPPSGDVSKIERDIENHKAKRNSLEAKTKVLRNVRSRLIKSISEFDLPAGTLAEARERKEEIGAQWKKLNQDIKDAEKVEADSIAARNLEDAKAKAVFKEQERVAKAEQQATLSPEEPPEVATKNFEKSGSFPKGQDDIPDFSTVGFQENTRPERLPDDKELQSSMEACDKMKAMGCEAIEKIMATMKKAGCEFCAAGMVAKSELRKLRMAK